MNPPITMDGLLAKGWYRAWHRDVGWIANEYGFYGLDGFRTLKYRDGSWTLTRQGREPKIIQWLSQVFQ